MIDTERAEFVLAVTAMAAAYDKAADEAMFDGYWITLADLPLDKVKAAIVDAMRECDHMPKAAQIRTRAKAATEAEVEEERRRVEQHRRHVESMGSEIVRRGLRAKAGEERIREELQRVGEQYGFELYWPGEEPWSEERAQRSYKPPQPLQLSFDTERH